MKKCQKCKDKLCLIYCSSCTTFYCLQCDRLTHNLLKNKNHKRRNITSSFLNLEEIKKNFNRNNIENLNNQNAKNLDISKSFKICNDLHKIENKEDPNIHLIKKLDYNLNNNLDNNENYKIEKNIFEYKNDFNKLYKYIKIINLKNDKDINQLLDIIEEQDEIIKNLFQKVLFLKQKIKENIYIEKNKFNKKALDVYNSNNINFIKDENYFEKKLDIINKIYEKEKEELIKMHEDTISKIQLKYNIIKDKYFSIIKYKDNKSKKNEGIDYLIKKLKSDKNNLNICSNKLAKLHDELNLVEFCLNGHIDELLIDELKNKNKKEEKDYNIKRYKSLNKI